MAFYQIGEPRAGKKRIFQAVGGGHANSNQAHRVLFRDHNRSRGIDDIRFADGIFSVQAFVVTVL